MTREEEHKLLKVMCDIIGYTNYEWDDYQEVFILSKDLPWYKWSEYVILDVIEIIFNKGFLDKLFEYIKNNDLSVKKGDYMNGYVNHIKAQLIDKSDRLVMYIYQLLFETK